MAARARALVLAGAALAGVAAGTLGHAVTDAPAAGPTRATTATPATTATKATTRPASPEGSTARASKPTSPTTTASTTAPPFTRAALLTPGEFLSRGWGSATRKSRVTGLAAVTLCAGLGGTAPVEAYTGTYQGRQTKAAEQVARYADAAAARAAVATVVRAVTTCDWALEPRPTTHVRGVDEARLWQGELKGERAVLGVVRVGDRALVLSLRSATSDPSKTTDVDSLFAQAGRRLV